MQTTEWNSSRALAVVVAATLSFALIPGGSAWGQASMDNSGGTINLGGRGWSAPEGRPDVSERSTNQFQFEVRGGFATDYIYRGTTLSDHKPAVGAAAEITMSGGVRRKIADINFDLGVTYYLYPGETSVSPSVDYWETAIRADKRISEYVRVAGGFAYSPNVSNTGAWSWYAAGGVGLEVPSRLLPPDIAVSFTGGAGYSWFGNQSQEFGGFALPAYLNWQAGATFTRKIFNLDLRYYDTNLSKENCFVLTGDPNARPGGVINPVTNPEGLTSSWCSTTFVAKIWFALN